MRAKTITVLPNETCMRAYALSVFGYEPRQIAFEFCLKTQQVIEAIKRGESLVTQC